MHSFGQKLKRKTVKCRCDVNFKMSFRPKYWVGLISLSIETTDIALS